MKPTPEELKREFAEKWQKDLHLKSYNGQIDKMIADLNELLDKLKKERGKAPGIDDFASRIDEIFEQGNPTKAQIYDAYNKAIDKLMPTEAECTQWLDTEDFGYDYHYHIQKAGAKLGIEWFRSRMKNEIR